MKRGDVWWVQFDPSVGTEIQKIRPAIIVSNDKANQKLSRYVVMPVTSNVKYFHPGQMRVQINNREGKAMADQIMAADRSRLKSFMCQLTDEEMAQVDDAIKLHLGL